MLMTNENVRLYPHDRIMAKTVLLLIPRWLRPNAFTILRVILTPAVLYFMWVEHWAIAIPAFLLVAFTDAIDGSLARTRKQITLFGTVADPVADKLLIGSVAILFIARQIHIGFAILIVATELLVVAMALIRYRKFGIVSANTFGKIKMLLQVAGIFCLLLSQLMIAPWAILVSIIAFVLAIIFAVISVFTLGI